VVVLALDALLPRDAQHARAVRDVAPPDPRHRTLRSARRVEPHDAQRGGAGPRPRGGRHGLHIRAQGVAHALGLAVRLGALLSLRARPRGAARRPGLAARRRSCSASPCLTRARHGRPRDCRAHRGVLRVGHGPHLQWDLRSRVGHRASGEILDVWGIPKTPLWWADVRSWDAPAASSACSSTRSAIRWSPRSSTRDNAYGSGADPGSSGCGGWKACGSISSKISSHSWRRPRRPHRPESSS
jgi:hypothetical protein